MTIRHTLPTELRADFLGPDALRVLAWLLAGLRTAQEVSLATGLGRIEVEAQFDDLYLSGLVTHQGRFYAPTCRFRSGCGESGGFGPETSKKNGRGRR